MSDPSSCDRKTGVCLSCLYETAGESCGQCREWFYGSAVKRQCLPCDCNKCGSETCDGDTGTCKCRENVATHRCDSCLPNHYGFQTCSGCKSCDCASASSSHTCDSHTGQCPCVSNSVTGRRCEECADGYWQYSSSGCLQCECGRNGSFTCDKETGKCLCKEGYTGTRCESCLPGWLPIEGIGCHACDECVRQLANEIYDEDKVTSDAFASLEKLSASVEARNRLSDLKNRLANVTITLSTSSPEDIVNHANDQMNELSKSLHSIKSHLDNFKKKMNEIKVNGDKFNMSSRSISLKFNNLTSSVTRLEQDLKDLVLLIRKYIESLRDPVQFNWKEMLGIAQSKIDEMESSLNKSQKETENWAMELAITHDLYNSVNQLFHNFTAAQKRLSDIQKMLNETLPHQMNDLDAEVGHILKTSEDLRLNISISSSELRETQDKILKISELEELAQSKQDKYILDMDAVNSTLSSCEPTHGVAIFEDMTEQCLRLEEEMADYVAEWQQDITRYNMTIVPRHQQRVQELESRVKAIEKQLFNPSDSQRQAIEVATRYDKIANTLEDAYSLIETSVSLVQELIENVTLVEQVENFRDRDQQINLKTGKLQREIQDVSYDTAAVDSKLSMEDRRRVETEEKIEQTDQILGMVNERDLEIGLDDLKQRSESAQSEFDSISAEAKLKDVESIQLMANLQGKDPEAERKYREAVLDIGKATNTIEQVELNWRGLSKVEQELDVLKAEIGELTQNMWALIGRTKEATAQLGDIWPSMLLNSSDASAEIAVDPETVASLGVDFSIDLQHLPCETRTPTSGWIDFFC